MLGNFCSAYELYSSSLTRHSRENGNPVSFRGLLINDLLDTRFRGYDIKIYPGIYVPHKSGATKSL